MTSQLIKSRKVDVFHADRGVVVEVHEQVDAFDVARSDVILWSDVTASVADALTSTWRSGSSCCCKAVLWRRRPAKIR